MTSRIVSAANFFEFDALLVPSARFPCNNLVVFNEQDNKLDLVIPTVL
jgi:hypothetical protein